MVHSKAVSLTLAAGWLLIPPGVLGQTVQPQPRSVSAGPRSESSSKPPQASQTTSRPSTAGSTAQAPGGRTQAPRRTSPDYRVVFWFQRGTLRHQVYDLRKGQYTRAVDDWVHRPRYDASGFYVLPGPLAVVRDVFLEDEKGDTEQEKLASAIAQTRKTILAPQRVEDTLARLRYRSNMGLFPPRLGAQGGMATLHEYGGARSALSANRSEGGSMGPSPGAGGLGPVPTSYSYPFPYPYPRPHP